MSFLGGPSAPKSPATPEVPVSTQADAEELARQKRLLDLRRMGRSSLIVDSATSVPDAGMASPLVVTPARQTAGSAYA